MKCRQCSAELPEGSQFCPECGTAVFGRPAAVTELMGGGTYVDTGGGGQRLEAGTEFDGRYTIEKVLGAGGMGVVYRAMDAIAGRPIALKLINQSMLSGQGALDRLIGEGLLTRDIRHPNVVAVYDVARAGDQPYVTMEYLEGESLRNWLSNQLRSGGEVTLEAGVGIIRAVLDGLQAAHDMGVVHRDLKPENVILLGEPNDDDFRLKLLDFGIARAVNVSMLQTSAAAMGTPLYMAPEQRTAADSAGPSADLYSLSRMFYELLMDVLPDGTWQPPSRHRSDVPEGIDALLEKGLSNRPRSRQQSVAEYRNELAAALAKPRSRTAPAAPPPRPEPEVRQKTPPPQQPAVPSAPQQQAPRTPPPKKKPGRGHGLAIVVVTIVGLITLISILGFVALVIEMSSYGY